MPRFLNNKIARYLFSGSTAAVVNLSALYILTDYFKIWYLFSSIIAFCLSLAVSFLMQKHITFREPSTERTKKQFLYYFTISVFNLSLNAIFMYILVDFLGLYYLLSQIVSSGIIAIESFFVYSILIFKKE